MSSIIDNWKKYFESIAKQGSWIEEGDDESYECIKKGFSKLASLGILNKEEWLMGKFNNKIVILYPISIKKLPSVDSVFKRARNFIFHTCR